jgi:hypothetical protein
MRLIIILAMALAPALLARQALGQVPVETVTVKLDLARARGLPRPKGPIDIKSYRGRYRYEIACFERLLPVEQHLRRCVDAQRLVSGEFHDRLDFIIEPSGKLKQFSVRRSRDQLQACLVPHVLSLRFPSFKGQPGPFTFQVLVGSPGARLGRKTAPTPVDVYPVKSEEELKRYRMAVFWVFSPWSMAIGRCAEWADQTVSYGYQARLAIAITPDGRARGAALEVKGKLADKGAELIAPCVVPFLKRLRVPRHAGPDDVVYRYGTSTAGWGIR